MATSVDFLLFFLSSFWVLVDISLSRQGHSEVNSLLLGWFHLHLDPPCWGATLSFQVTEEKLNVLLLCNFLLMGSASSVCSHKSPLDN